jgi:hypothetical protein
VQVGLQGGAHEPSRALRWLVVIFALAVVLVVPAGVQSVAVHPTGTSAPGTHCSTIEQIGLQLAGWTLATLFVAGFTGIIRK